MLYIQLHLASFMLSTLLLSWGVFVLFFLAIGGLSVDGAMNHLNNLTVRYLAAAPARAGRFKELLATANLFVMLAIIVLRRGSIMPAGSSNPRGRR